MLYKLPFLTELVFAMVGAYLVALPAFGNKAARVRAENAVAGNITLHVERMATKVIYRLGDEGAKSGSLQNLAVALQGIAVQSPRPGIRIAVGKHVPYGDVLAASKLCSAAGFEIVYAGSITNQE